MRLLLFIGVELKPKLWAFLRDLLNSFGLGILFKDILFFCFFLFFLFEEKRQFLFLSHLFLYVNEIRTYDLYIVGFTNNQQIIAHWLKMFYFIGWQFVSIKLHKRIDSITG